MLKRVVCVLLAVCGVFSCTMVAYAAESAANFPYSALTTSVGSGWECLSQKTLVALKTVDGQERNYYYYATLWQSPSPPVGNLYQYVVKWQVLSPIGGQQYYSSDILSPKSGNTFNTDSVFTLSLNVNDSGTLVANLSDTVVYSSQVTCYEEGQTRDIIKMDGIIPPDTLSIEEMRAQDESSGGSSDNKSYVQWSSWGNAVTTEGQYINVAYPASITYNLYTRGDAGHKYALAIREYDDNNQPGDIVYHCLIPVKEEMQPNKKYTIKQFFNTNALLRNLNKGQKYVLHCLDLTTSEYVGSVGFIPGSNVECLPTIPQSSMDSWWFADSNLGPGETPTDPPIGSADDIFQPPNLPNGEGGSNNGGGAGVGGIIDNVGNFFNGVISVFTEIGDGLGQLATTMSTSITTLTGVGGQFKGFLASAVPFIPPEIMTLIGLGLTLSILAMVIKAFR